MKPDLELAVADEQALWPLVSRKPLPVMHVISDLHLESGPYELPADLEFDILVAAGDIGPVEVAVPWLAKHGKPVVYVLGNHERWGTDFSAAVTLAKSLAQGTQVHVLEKEQVVIQGVRFLGATLWTDLQKFSPPAVAAVGRFMRDYAHVTAGEWLSDPDNVRRLRALCKKHKLPPHDARNVENGPPELPKLHPGIPYLEHQRTLSWLARTLARKFCGPTVVVTHHAPSFESLRQSGISDDALKQGRFSWKDNTPARIAAYASEVLTGPALPKNHGIDLWAHGHVHVAMQYCENAVRVVCNPRGSHEKPLTQEGAESFRFFGYPLPADAVENSQRRFLENPYGGSGEGFERTLRVRLEDGFAEPLTRACADDTQRLEELQQELQELLPVAGRGSGLRARSVTEAFERRLAEMMDIAAGLQERVTAQVRDPSRGYLDARQLAPPGGAYLRARWEPNAAPHTPKDFKKAADAAGTVVAWARALPWVARRGLLNWGQVALEALEYLQSRGIPAKVALCAAQGLHCVTRHGELVLWREPPLRVPQTTGPAVNLGTEPPRDADVLREIEAAPALLEQALDELLNKKTIPRPYDIRLLDSPLTGTSAVGLKELKRRLALTGTP